MGGVSVICSVCIIIILFVINTFFNCLFLSLPLPLPPLPLSPSQQLNHILHILNKKGDAIAWEPSTAPNYGPVPIVRYITELPPEVDDRLSPLVINSY